MRRLHHMTICSEGVYYLVIMGFILTAALIRQINLLMVVYGVLAGPLLLSWGLVRRQVKQIDILRRAPKTATAGEPFSVELEVQNQRRHGGSFALAVRDELERRSGGGGNRAGKTFTTDVYCDYVAAGESRRLTYQGRIARRGLYEFQPLKLSSRFPLGLLRTMIRIDKPQRLTVLPRLGRLSPAWQRLLRTEDGGSSRGRLGVGVQEGDFYGLREWRPGDPRNRIHWRTSARRQSLTVRQFERRHDADLLLVVELWEPAKPTEADRARTESVISFVATVAAEASRDGNCEMLVHLVAKRSRRIEGRASSALLDDVRQALATAEPVADDGLPVVLAGLAGGKRPQTNVLVVSTRAVDLRGDDRFADVRSRPELQPWLDRALCLTPTDAQWSNLFREVDA